MIRAALLLAAALAAGGAAAGTCLMPLEGGAPVNEVEARQPYRIIQESGTIEGFPFVLASVSNRENPDRQFYTVRGMRYEPLGAEFPRAALWVSKTTPPRADGSIYGWLVLGRQLYRLAPGADAFLPVPDTEGASRVSYDPAGDRLMMLKDGHLYDVAADGISPSPLGGFSRAGPMADPSYYPDRFTLPRFVPPLGIYLAADEIDDTIWTRTADGVWTPLDLGDPVHQAWRIESAEWHEDAAERTIAFLVGGTALVFDTRARGVPDLLYRVTYGPAALPDDGPALVWERASDPRQPRLVRLVREGPKPPPGETVAGASHDSSQAGTSAIPRVGLVDLPAFEAVLVRHAAGVSVYAKGHLAPAPQFGPDWRDRVYRVVQFGGRVFLRASDGLYELGPDLMPVKRPFPFVPTGRWEIHPSAAFGGAIVRDDAGGRAWLTADGQSFEPIRNLTGKRLRAIGSDIPGRRAVLAATEGGAALIGDCP